MKELTPLWLVVLAGCNSAFNYTDASGPRYGGDFRAEQPAARSGLKVVSFNIEFARRSAEAAQDLQADQRLAQADFVLLQEMTPEGSEIIARALSMSYVYYPASQNEGGDFGQAILSRWELLSDSKLILPFVDPVNGRQRIAVFADALVGTTTVSVASIHNLTPVAGPAARLAQAEAAIEFVGRAPYAIIGGDFNTGDPGAEDATIETFENAGYTYASVDAIDTGEGKVGVWTLDYIFARGFNSAASGTVESDVGDHDPIWADLSWL